MSAANRNRGPRTGGAGVKAIVLHQPWATLVAIGVKEWETRPSPPNGTMRPDGVRGLPGLPIEPGERIAIVAGARKPPEGMEVGDYCVERWRDEPAEPCMAGPYRPALGYRPMFRLPLGAVVCTAVVAEALPMVGDYDDVSSAYEGPAAVEVVPGGSLIQYPAWDGVLYDEDGDPHETDGARCVDISDQLPYGDWTLGRWAWRLTDVQSCDPIPVKGRQGVFDLGFKP